MLTRRPPALGLLLVGLVVGVLVVDRVGRVLGLGLGVCHLEGGGGNVEFVIMRGRARPGRW